MCRVGWSRLHPKKLPAPLNQSAVHKYEPLPWTVSSKGGEEGRRTEPARALRSHIATSSCPSSSSSSSSLRSGSPPPWSPASSPASFAL